MTHNLVIANTYGARQSVPTPSSLRSRVTAAAIRSLLKGITDSFALITLAVPKSCYSLGARTTFDRGASFCSLYPAPQALATSLRMTRGEGVITAKN